MTKEEAIKSYYETAVEATKYGLGINAGSKRVEQTPSASFHCQHADEMVCAGLSGRCSRLAWNETLQFLSRGP